MDSVDDAVEATVDAVDEVVEEATVDEVVDDADDAVAAASTSEEDGIFYNNEDGKPVTTITYASNGAKKNAKDNVATITNTTDPISWNNAYATDLIHTVLDGDKDDDEYLNNSSKASVSNNTKGAIPTLRTHNDSWRYEVIPVVEGSQYLFVGYGLADVGNEDGDVYYYSEYVDGYSDLEPAYEKFATGGKYAATLPVLSWDGRTIDFNKSGNRKFSTGSKEALDVKMSFVTFNNGTVTEEKDVNLGSVKVDKKNQKAASVAAEESAFVWAAQNSYKEDGKTIEAKSQYIGGHKTLGDLPFFTIKAKVGKDAKSYKKDIAAKLKDKKFYFGIEQYSVRVSKADDSTLNKVTASFNKVSTVSESKISDNQIEEVEKAIADVLTNAQDFDKDVDKIDLAGFTVTKFTDKGATITLNDYVGDKKAGYKWASTKTISGKGKNAEYTFEDGTLANTTVKVLTFKDGGNFVYTPLDKEYDADGKETKVFNTRTGNLAPAGFKWAFRQTPAEKAKTFRYGIYKTTNQGFVYSVDETAVDSVEEAF